MRYILLPYSRPDSQEQTHGKHRKFIADANRQECYSRMLPNPRYGPSISAPSLQRSVGNPVPVLAHGTQVRYLENCRSQGTVPGSPARPCAQHHRIIAERTRHAQQLFTAAEEKLGSHAAEEAAWTCDSCGTEAPGLCHKDQAYAEGPPRPQKSENCMCVLPGARRDTRRSDSVPLTPADGVCCQ
eukprot:SAG31_NODE_723_length_12568_cov_3.102494_14_plen_185_part_00